MAEPLSLTGTTLCLALSTWRICQTAYSLVKGIRDAPKQIQRLRVDLQGLCHVLSFLNATLGAENVMNASVPPQMVADLEELLHSCTKLCDDVRIIVSEFIGLDGTGIWKSIKWEVFKRDDVAALQDTLRTFKLTISMTCSALTLAAGNSTNAIVEQIQKDVQVLRWYAEKQDSQGLPQPSNGNRIGSIPNRNSASRLSIASYGLPLRRFLTETESLVKAEFTSRQSSYQVNSNVDSPVLRSFTSTSSPKDLSQVLIEVSEVLQPAFSPGVETVRDEASHPYIDVVRINSIKSTVAEDAPIQIRLNGHAALCKHFNVTEKGIITKFQLWRAFNQDQLGNLLRTEVCSVGANYSCSRISFSFENAFCVSTYNYTNRVPFFKPVIKIEEPEILPFSQFICTLELEHNGKCGIKIKWLISSQSHDSLCLWFRSRSTRDELFNLFKTRVDGEKPSRELVRSLDHSVKEELNGLGWTALSGSI